MSRTKFLSGALRRELGEVARERLMQSLDAVSHSPAGPPADPPDLGRLLVDPIAGIGPQLSRDAHWVLTRDPDLGRHELWNDVCRRADALGRELRNTNLPPTAEERKDRLVNLSFFAAGVMVPLLAERGVYRRAVLIAEAVRRLVMSESHRFVLGAGAEGADPRMRFLVLGPMIWSLAAFHPAARTQRSEL